MKTLTRFILAVFITGVTFVYAQNVTFYSIFVNNSSKDIYIQHYDGGGQWDNWGWCDYGGDWGMNHIAPKGVLVKCGGTYNNHLFGYFRYHAWIDSGEAFSPFNSTVKQLDSGYEVDENDSPAQLCIYGVTCFRINDQTGNEKGGLAIYTFDDKGVAVTFLQSSGYGFYGKIYDNHDYNFSLDSYSCGDGRDGRNSQSGGCSTYINYN